jgi:hypothetical protein
MAKAAEDKENIMSPEGTQDKFVAMVSAKADVTLPLSEFHPRCMLTTPAHEIPLPRFPVIDYHNHLDAQDPDQVLKIMDACGIEHIVNITMKVGEEAIQVIDRFHAADAARFSTIGWMDWAGVERSDFVNVSVERLERLVEHGAAIDANNERYEELAAHPDWGFHGAEFSKHQLLEQRDRVFSTHGGADDRSAKAGGGRAQGGGRGERSGRIEAHDLCLEGLLFDIHPSPFFRQNHTQLCAERGEQVTIMLRCLHLGDAFA